MISGFFLCLSFLLLLFVLFFATSMSFIKMTFSKILHCLNFRFRYIYQILIFINGIGLFQIRPEIFLLIWISHSPNINNLKKTATNICSQRCCGSKNASEFLYLQFSHLVQILQFLIMMVSYWSHYYHRNYRTILSHDCLVNFLLIVFM